MRDVISDAEILRLIKAAQRFERRAFDELYNLYADKLYRFIYFRVDDESLAEDLVAEVFLRVLNRIGDFQGMTTASFSAWLYRIARNLLTDYYRRRSKEETVAFDHTSTMPDPEASPADEAEKRQAHQALHRAIAHLTPDQQQVILFKFFEGMGNAQVAEILGKTEGSVKSLQHRALAALGRLLHRG